MYVSQFWQSNQAAGRFGVWWGRAPSSWMAILSLCPHRVKGWTLGTNPIHKGSTIILKVRASMYELGKNTKIQQELFASICSKYQLHPFAHSKKHYSHWILCNSSGYTSRVASWTYQLHVTILMTLAMIKIVKVIRGTCDKIT